MVPCSLEYSLDGCGYKLKIIFKFRSILALEYYWWLCEMDGVLCDEHDKITVPYCGWLRPQQSSLPAEIAVLVGYGSCLEVLSSPLSFSFYTYSFFYGHIYGYVYSFPIVCVDADNVFRLVLVRSCRCQRAENTVSERSGAIILH